MEITLPLLGTINKGASRESPLRTKYVVKITAERLAQLLVYERRGKRRSDPFRILPTSTIRIDKDIQRGLDAQGFHLQQPKKVLDIAASLLGDPKCTVPRVYLGTLIWNIREPNPFALAKREVEGRPPEWELSISTEAIFLTDSAHRHLGIVEAYRTYMADKAAYPAFRPSFEFAIELYNLALTEEKELFSELNAKQKKITAAKQKEMDVSSPIGALKDAILAYDMGSDGSRKLLDNNIEVSSNKNDKHTLMTMSVFVSSIDEMFTTEQIREARLDEDTREEYAAFYCEFLYKLHDTIVVHCDLGKGEEEVRPFSNLWLELIKPVEDSYESATPLLFEEQLDKIRQAATQRNQLLRKLDLSNHNGTIKALFRLGGIIRKLPNWSEVVVRLHTDLNVPMGGQFFQAANRDLFSKDSDSDIPIASKNEDGSLNLQVQTKNITKLYRYLRRKLSLDLPAIFQLRQGAGEWLLLRNLEPNSHWTLSEEAQNIRVVQFLFCGVRGNMPEYENVQLAVVPGFAWKEGTRKGAKRIAPSAIRLDEGYQHPYYQDVVRYIATFEVNLPAAPSATSGQIALEVTYPELDDAELKATIAMPCSVE